MTRRATTDFSDVTVQPVLAAQRSSRTSASPPGKGGATSLSRPQVGRKQQLYSFRHAPVGFDVDLRGGPMAVIARGMGQGTLTRRSASATAR